VACSYHVTNNWGSGFIGEIRLTNNSSTSVEGWTVSWLYSGATQITQSWNAILSGSNPYSATNKAWNATIEPGEMVKFGFQGSGGDSSEIPTVTGSICE
jgi:cellulase/cellobiase CelA1